MFYRRKEGDGENLLSNLWRPRLGQIHGAHAQVYPAYFNGWRSRVFHLRHSTPSRAVVVACLSNSTCLYSGTRELSRQTAVLHAGRWPTVATPYLVSSVAASVPSSITAKFRIECGNNTSHREFRLQRPLCRRGQTYPHLPSATKSPQLPTLQRVQQR